MVFENDFVAKDLKQGFSDFATNEEEREKGLPWVYE